MPKGAVLVNTARKEVIDEDGLLKVFEEREDFSYLSDIEPDSKAVFEEKYVGRYFFTPKKMGAQTKEANMNAGIAASRQIVDFFTTGNEKFRVN
jgi:D-3-phosphoglycerate dehydrogenase